MSRNFSTRLVLLMFFISVLPSRALEVADIFSSHMVLQAEKEIVIWGEGQPNSLIKVRLGSEDQTSQILDNGSWKVSLKPRKASFSPINLSISNNESRVEFEDILIGEVWYASGQSNMQWTMNQCASKRPQIQNILNKAQQIGIRYRHIRNPDKEKPQHKLGDKKLWLKTTPVTARNYSAVAYMFALRLHDKLNSPIGIIEGAWGGHPIEPFIPVNALNGHPVLEKILELGNKGDLDGLRELEGGVFARNNSWLPGRIFHSRVAPITSFKIRGVIWYQAESNCGKGEDPRFYAEKMKALISGWRSEWREPQLPFYFVQLPQYPSRGWTYMRDEQRRALGLPNSGMTVTIDLELDNIHPSNKWDVAERLSRWPLSQVYQKNIEPTGPIYKSAELEENKFVVSFDHVGKGLAVGIKKDLQPADLLESTSVSGFELLDKKGQWHQASAKIEDNKIVCQTELVPHPIGVRYAWAPIKPNPEDWNLYNKDGLPASPFISNPELDPFVHN